MDALRKYQIAFVGLKNRIHHFGFHADKEFFGLFENSILKEADIEVKLNFDKRPSLFLLEFIISGTVKLPCDRCGVELKYPVDSDYHLVVKFDEHRDEEKDDSMADVIYINRNDSHLDVSQVIYEFITLSIPFNHITCDNLQGKKPCDQDMLKRLNQHAVKENVDHRWDDLTKFKFN